MGRAAFLVGETGPCADALRAAGFQVVTSADEADVVVIGIGLRRATPIDGSREQALADFTELVEANTRDALLLQRGLTGRTSDVILLTIADVLPSSPHQPADPATDVFATSMWARNGFTQAWAMALRERGVRVNAIAVGPGGPDDGAARTLVALLAEGVNGRTGETIGSWSDVLPARRLRGEDIV